MQTPLRITFHGLDPSDAIEARVRAEVDELERVHGRVTSCHVTIDAPAAHRRKGGTWAVRIALVVPGGELPVTRESGRDGSHVDPYIVLRDAFDAARRRLDDFNERRAP